MESRPERRKVFISYSHRDRRFLDELQQHLMPLERQRAVELWDDTKLAGGEHWKAEIEHALSEAKVVICLVSKHFRASKFIVENELPPLLAAARSEGVIILPVVVGFCDYANSELADVQAMNDPVKPLDSMRPHERDRIWLEVARSVKGALSDAQPNRPQSVVAIIQLAFNANIAEDYMEAVNLIRPLLEGDAIERNSHEAFAAWFECAFAMAHLEPHVAVRAFMRAYNDANPYRRVLGYNDVKFPDFCRYGVFTGRGSGVFAHGLGELPDDVFLVSQDGNTKSVHTVDGATGFADAENVYLTDIDNVWRWVGVASKWPDYPDNNAPDTEMGSS